MLPFLFGIMVPVVLASLAIVGWAIATSEPAPDYADADLTVLRPSQLKRAWTLKSTLKKLKAIQHPLRRAGK